MVGLLVILMLCVFAWILFGGEVLSVDHGKKARKNLAELALLNVEMDK